MHRTHIFTLMGKVEARWYLCETCELWASEEPYWLDDAYVESMSSLDTGAAARTLLNRRVLAPLLKRLFGAGPFVDWAGGPGLLVRMMRDLGLDFYWQDAYTPNVFALGFEWTSIRFPASAVTAIEVFEHVPDPAAFLDNVLAATGTDSLFFTQLLHHGPDADWWYRVPETGQHVTFYSTKTLETLAARFGMRYLHVGGDHHLFTRRADISAMRLRLERKASRLTFPLLSHRAKPLTQVDHERASRARG